MKKIGLVFPHQLFQSGPLLDQVNEFYLIEESLFFNQYAFHKQKIAFHRASMQYYADWLKERGKTVFIAEAKNPESDVRACVKMILQKGQVDLICYNPTDYMLERRLNRVCDELNCRLTYLDNPLFLNTSNENRAYFDGRKRLFQTDYYIHQRKQRQILLDIQEKPLGGKWSFDDENRLSYPKKQVPPAFPGIKLNSYYQEALRYTETNFSSNPGSLTQASIYPVTHADSRDWLDEFLENRFSGFGPYEDAIVAKEHFLHHSVLTPMLNVGLITPQEIIDRTLNFALKNQIPLNSLEGFIRQIIGWREFIRAVYEYKGTTQRTTNFWGFKRKIPDSFYTGTTGIPPIDITIKKILKTGYCHHIERLMVLGNFMVLCEFDPDEVYRWFMELFIDAYDWVMVPNVYGMSQFADGGLMTTKPYISGSNYLMKMSDFEKGEWQPVWDGLFWRFMDVNRTFFLQNPRLGMLIRTFDKMPESKRLMHVEVAERYLDSLE